MRHREAGLSALEFGKHTRHGHEDITAPVGILWASEGMCSVKEGGTSGWTPNCAAWGFMSANTNFRTGTNVLGDPSRLDVQEANLTCVIMRPLFVNCSHVHRARMQTRKPE